MLQLVFTGHDGAKNRTKRACIQERVSGSLSSQRNRFRFANRNEAERLKAPGLLLLLRSWKLDLWEIRVVSITGIALALLRREWDADVVRNYVGMQELAWLQIRACDALVALAFIPVGWWAGRATVASGRMVVHVVFVHAFEFKWVRRLGEIEANLPVYLKEVGVVLVRLDGKGLFKHYGLLVVCSVSLTHLSSKNHVALVHQVQDDFGWRLAVEFQGQLSRWDLEVVAFVFFGWEFEVVGVCTVLGGAGQWDRKQQRVASSPEIMGLSLKH